MIREGDKSMEKLKKLMNSYVPEFAYEPGASDPRSVHPEVMYSFSR